MKGKIRFLGLVMALALAAVIAATSAPSWAQKGKPQPPQPPADPAIAYTVWYPSGTATDHKDLIVANADGTNRQALISLKGVHNHLPDWSPDGTKLVFVDNALGYHAINIINVDGTGQPRILSLYNSIGSPVWSPVELGDEQDKQYKIAFFDRGLNPDVAQRQQ